MSDAEDEKNLAFREHIRDAIQAGGKSGAMSKKTGIPIGTLNKYVALRSEPSAMNALKIAQAVGMTLEELAAGKKVVSLTDKTVALEDEVSLEIRKVIPVDAELIERLHDHVARIFHEVGQKAPARRISRETANVYNALASHLEDMSDRELVEAALPMVLLEFKRKLERAELEPGTGKRSA